MSADMGDVTGQLERVRRGDRAALDELLPLVYDELRRMASAYMRDERAAHTLQPTALVHEAYMRLIGQRTVDWHNRAQFFGVAAEMMRRILVNHAAARNTNKRKGVRVPLDDALAVFEQEQRLDLIALNEALDQLAAFDPQQSKIVELKFFAGLTIVEIAKLLELSPAKVQREWSMAQAWLYQRMKAEGGSKNK